MQNNATDMLAVVNHGPNDNRLERIPRPRARANYGSSSALRPAASVQGTPNAMPAQPCSGGEKGESLGQGTLWFPATNSSAPSSKWAKARQSTSMSNSASA